MKRSYYVWSYTEARWIVIHPAWDVEANVGEFVELPVANSVFEYRVVYITRSGSQTVDYYLRFIGGEKHDAEAMAERDWAFIEKNGDNLTPPFFIDASISLAKL